MGFRTVVMLNNDHAHEWSKDPELGSKIATAMNFAGSKGDRAHHADLGYGCVVECTHADTVTLAMLDFYQGFHPIDYVGWRSSETEEEKIIRLMKGAADKLGYRLVKKSRRQSP